MLGQLTFGQFAVAGFAAAVAVHVSLATGQFLAGVLVGAVVGALVNVVVGLPGVRLRGPLLAVVTLGFALASRWLFQRGFLFGAGLSPGGARIGPLEVSGSRSYAYVAIVSLLAVLWLVRNVRSSWFGRRLVALRDNEDAARAFAVPALVTKLQAYALAGAVAGVGGAVYAHGFSSVAQTDFPVAASIDVVALTVLGGLGTLVGPILGALYIIGVPRFLPLDSAGLAATQVGWLLLVLYLPGGIAAAIRPLRDRLALAYARRVGLAVVPDTPAEVEPGDEPRRGTWGASDGAGSGPATLSVTGVERSFGGVRAVAGVDLQVAAGEIVGLIGPNGAGKTTLFEIISGFTRPDQGSVHLDGVDISTWAPERRTSVGLVRSFQDAALFQTMTVEQVVRLALDSRGTPGLIAALRGADPSRSDADERVDEVLAAAGLDPYRTTAVGALSTGTRRICELASLAVLRPRVLLLDEPSSGVAQREVEALGPLIRDLARTLDTTVVLIEHDMPLVRSVVDRLVVMATGTVLADGEPDEVLRDPAVIDAYLGGSSVAVERSGVS
jgi:ABC-type branched-subunit amino acid transport system ATPase component/ABC-type branched-subunit amino acid transport system permease subunit